MRLELRMEVDLELFLVHDLSQYHKYIKCSINKCVMKMMVHWKEY